MITCYKCRMELEWLGDSAVCTNEDCEFYGLVKLNVPALKDKILQRKARAAKKMEDKRKQILYSNIKK